MSEAEVRVELPAHLRTLVGVAGAVKVRVQGPVTTRAVLDSLEAAYPTLKGTIRQYGTLERRAFLRFFVCEEDWSLESVDAPLPEKVARGEEPFMVIGAVAGG